MKNVNRFKQFPFYIVLWIYLFKCDKSFVFSSDLYINKTNNFTYSVTVLFRIPLKPSLAIYLKQLLYDTIYCEAQI